MTNFSLQSAAGILKSIFPTLFMGIMGVFVGCFFFFKQGFVFIVELTSSTESHL